MTSGVSLPSQTSLMMICEKEKWCTCHLTAAAMEKFTTEHGSSVLSFFSAQLQHLPCPRAAVDSPSEVICILGAILELSKRVRPCEIALNFI